MLGVRRWFWRLSVVGLVATLSWHVLAQTPNDLVASVNKHPIHLSEINAIVDARPMPVPVPKGVKSELQEAALEMLIDDALMRQFLETKTNSPNSADVERELSKLKEVLVNQKKSIDEFLLESKQTLPQLRADIAAKLRWKDYLTINLPEPDMKKYYDENKVFFDKIFVRASHILVKISSSSTPEENAKAKEKIEAIRNMVLAGKIGFDEAAKQYSECPSKEKGGDIGQFPYKFVVVPEFAQTAFSLKVGEVSPIIRTNFGLHVIKLTDRTLGEPSTFDNLKDTVREVYAQDREFYQQILARQRQTADIKRYVKFSQ